MDMAEHFRVQAAACRRLDSPMYASLLRRVAEDIDEGGVCCTVLSGREHDSGPSALALRLAGSVHRLVLNSEVPELARYYPSVGGAWDAAAGRLAFEAVLRTRAEDVRRWLDHPPQTNEVGRAAALMGGLLRIGETIRLPIRLFELGSSAGLNLRADHLGYTDDAGSAYGDPHQRLGAARGLARTAATPLARALDHGTARQRRAAGRRQQLRRAAYAALLRLAESTSPPGAALRRTRGACRAGVVPSTPPDLRARVTATIPPEEASMAADNTTEGVRATMRAALERKQSNDRGVEHKDHARGKGPETHGAIGAKREFRRKSG